MEGDIQKSDNYDGKANPGFIFFSELPILVISRETTPASDEYANRTEPSFLPPQILTSSGTETAGGVMPAIGDLTTVPPPHLRVIFLLHRIEHKIISGEFGVGSADIWFKGLSGVTNLENYTDWGMFAPNPGKSTDYTGHIIYEGLVLEGCGNTPFFPFYLRSWITEPQPGGVILPGAPSIGEFEGVDDGKLNQNGIYTFRYNIRAEDTNDGVSEFKVSGSVARTCTNIDSFE